MKTLIEANNIIPSTKLKILTVHKVWSTSCWRKYFWKWVLNLEPRKINLNFWYGSVLHTGFETLLIKKSLTASLQAMKMESRKRCARYILSSDDYDEVEIQFQIISAIITEASRRPFIERMKLDWTEKQFSYRLEPSGISFHCTADGGGTYEGDNTLYEIKTARSIPKNYLTALEFDKQVYGEICAMKASGLDYPTKCAYCVFHKPSKYVKKNQSVDDFIKEIQQDLKKRPNWYFVPDVRRKEGFPYLLFIGKNTLESTDKDLNTTAEMLQQRYDVGEDRLLDPAYWPMNTRQCLNFGTCPYFILCRYPKRYKLYMKLYQQREMLYKEEGKELQK